MLEFSCTVEERENFFIVRPSGYLDDAGGKQLLAFFEVPFKKGIKKQILNLSGTPVINSQGITHILELVETILYDQKAQLALVGLSELYVDVFQVVGILKMIKLFPNEETALKEF